MIQIGGLNLLQVCGTEDPLLLTLRGGGVRRYHGEGHLPTQTVAEHSWRVAMIATYIWPDRPQLVVAALFHDVAEGLTGDVPAPMKRVPEMRAAIREIEAKYEAYLGIARDYALDQIDLVRLKCADYLELVEYCSHYPNIDGERIKEVGEIYVAEAVEALPEVEREGVVRMKYHLLRKPYPNDRTGQDRPFGYAEEDGA